MNIFGSVSPDDDSMELDNSNFNPRPDTSTQPQSNDDNSWLTDMLEGDAEMAASFITLQKKYGPLPEKVQQNITIFESTWKARNEIKQNALEGFGITLSPVEEKAFEDEETALAKRGGEGLLQQRDQFKKANDWFAVLASSPELVLELAQFMSPKDLVSMYAISKGFHDILDGYLSSAVRKAARYHAPESARIFSYRFHDSLCVIDPAGRPHPYRTGTVRKAPGLRWLQMVCHREKVIRDILALMARQGHRMTPGMSLTLKKTWFTMDISTTIRRNQVMHDRKFWTDMDLYNLQLFIVKLDMRLNDPYEGMGEDGTRKLFLGQRGLTPLRNFLGRISFKTLPELIKLSIRYDYNIPRQNFRSMPIWDIPPWEVGVGHLEGWGAGCQHLRRPDELVMRESVRRGLGLKHHLMHMLLYGYVDPITGLNIEVTDEEMHMSDEEDEKRRVKRRGKDTLVEAFKDEGDMKDEDA